MVGRTRRTGRIVGVVRHQAKIDRPRERVFDYIDGYQNVPEYLLGVTRFEPTTEKTNRNQISGTSIQVPMLSREECMFRI